MALDKMNTQDLKYFVKLTEIKNFSQVAAQFNVSQPTITFALQRLEKELGTTLISRHRARGTLTVTTTGAQLLIHARAMIDHEALLQKEIEAEKAGQLRLGLPPIIETQYFTGIAKALKAQGLLSKIQTFEAGSSTALQALKRGDIDLTLMGSIAPLAEQHIVTQVFNQTPFAIYMAADDPLADPKGITFKQVKDRDFVMFKDGFIHNQAFNQLARRARIRPKVVFRSNEIQGLMNLIAGGIGMGFMMTAVAPARQDVVPVPLLDADMPTFISSLAYRDSHVFSPLQREILGVIEGCLLGK
ncbi:malolactic regulator [Secundilactobacillus paracollinoides DSM 15502 = JCM 11969]|nr:malolactic regulator [Secundilactobacillus paracollinoides DSM 15502 = JCM 11969]